MARPSKFQSTLPVRGATGSSSAATVSAGVFQSTLPVRGATRQPLKYFDCTTDFNPRSPCGERPSVGGVRLRPRKISIHAPRAGSDTVTGDTTLGVMHFNPRSPCGERRWNKVMPDEAGKISIHAPRAGSDRRGFHRESDGRYFNPRSPCGERRKSIFRALLLTHFNPRSPCGERRSSLWHSRMRKLISIHAPRAGSDQHFLAVIPRRADISIHAPRAGSDNLAAVYDFGKPTISIHAPRAGSDATLAQDAINRHDFNPRSPCGERRAPASISRMAASFQSTLPVRGATL